MHSFILPVDKPVGPTSHDIVAIARRALGTRRIGHTGTLDPFASGLLLLCINDATRLVEYLADLPKSYRAFARFDGSTPTDDATVELSARSDKWQQLSADDVRRAFAMQMGKILQTPSSFSAKKIGGERAYEVARRGDTVDLAPVEVTVYDINVTRINLPEVEFEVDCSSGTYIRAIARDVGHTLGTGGYLTVLRRTAIGPHEVSSALVPETLVNADQVNNAAIGMLKALRHMKTLVINAEEAAALAHGKSIERDETPGVVALAFGDELVAIGQSDSGQIRPKKVFARD
jgi:tRNA pseudouridine55 synthase